jgi:chromosome-anchoring protein RacA
MEYKTPMIAEKMGVSPKVVIRIVQQLNLEIKKNKFGHYVFNEEDVQKIMANYSSCQETAATTSPSQEPEASSSTPQHRSIKKQESSSSTSEHFHVLKKQMDDMEYRLLQNEERLRQKADSVVQYQLLQHRNDIEELQKKVESLEVALEQLETRKQPLAVVPDYSATKPKRRSIIFSIFGL